MFIKFNTISSKLNFIISISMLFIIITIFTFTYFNNKSDFETKLYNDIQTINKRLELILPPVIWDFQTNLAKNIIEIEALNDSVDAIIIKELDGTTITSVINNDIKTKNLLCKNTNLLKVNCKNQIDINYNSNKIATIDLYYNDNIVIDSSEKLLTSLFVRILLILLFFNILFRFFINKLVIKHIIHLQEQVLNFSKNKNFNKNIVINTNDEINILANEFNNMKNSLKTSWDDLKQLNSNLEIEILKEVEETKRIQSRLFKSEKLAAMGEMIGNISHQWRQPLSVISTSATGMQMKKECGILTDEMLEKHCTDINNNAQYLSKTIDDFKNFIKGDREKKLCNLEETIKSFITLVDGTIKKHNINIVLDLDKNINFNSYSNELIQCFMNIFNNSKDALNENDIDEKYFFIKSYQENNHIYISFQDNANGIPNDILNNIFEPYFTTKHQSQGTGLGLSMLIKLIEEGMNGSIEAKNIEYVHNNIKYTGAQFIIKLSID